MKGSFLILGLCAALAACGEQAPVEVVAQEIDPPPPESAFVSEDNDVALAVPVPPEVEGEPRELDWDALIPEGYRPEEALEQLEGIDDMADSDPRAAEAMAKLKALWDEAPVVDELDGQYIKMPGFVVPVEMVDNRVSEFLLVPYFGACIHVPPPPANQTVYVHINHSPIQIDGLFDAVWISGVMRVKRFSAELAEAGYVIEGVQMEPYE